jgi:hypothetical protein
MAARGKNSLTEDDRNQLRRFLSPLDQMYERLEQESKSEDKRIKALAHDCLVLLNVFSTEPAQCYYFHNKMRVCDVHGLVSKVRCPTCPDYDSWFFAIDQTCENCVHRIEVADK